MLASAGRFGKLSAATGLRKQEAAGAAAQGCLCPYRSHGYCSVRHHSGRLVT
jgi:hypothetical protein